MTPNFFFGWPDLGGEKRILKKLEVLMAQIDDLKAGLEAIDLKLDAVRDGVASVDATVKALLELVGQTPVDLTEVVAKVQSLAAEVDVVNEALNAVPKPPAPEA